MKFELDHIGVAVESLEKGKKFYEALGLGQMSVERVETEKVTVGMFDLANDSRIELLEPTEPTARWEKFFEESRARHPSYLFKGQRHPATIKSLKASGVQMIHDEPKAWRTRSLDCIYPSQIHGRNFDRAQPTQRGAGVNHSMQNQHQDDPRATWR